MAKRKIVGGHWDGTEIDTHAHSIIIPMRVGNRRRDDFYELQEDGTYLCIKTEWEERG